MEPNAGMWYGSMVPALEQSELLVDEGVVITAAGTLIDGLGSTTGFGLNSK